MCQVFNHILITALNLHQLIRLQFVAAAHRLDAILLGSRKMSAVDIPKAVFIINYFRRNRP